MPRCLSACNWLFGCFPAQISTFFSFRRAYLQSCLKSHALPLRKPDFASTHGCNAPSFHGDVEALIFRIVTKTSCATKVVQGLSVSAVFLFVYLKCARTLWHFLICSVSDVNKSTGRPVQPQERTKNKQTTKNNAVVERAP